MTRQLLSSSLPVILFATFVSATPAGAQSIAQPRSWTVTPFLNSSAGMGDPAPDNSIGLGVSIGYDLTRNLGFEGEIGHLFDVAGDTDEVDWSITNFNANALYHFDVKRVTPYATFGLGFERSAFDWQDSESLAMIADPSATEITVNFGGGVKYPLNDRWLARADLRRFQANDEAPDFWRVYGGLTWTLKR